MDQRVIDVPFPVVASLPLAGLPFGKIRQSSKPMEFPWWERLRKGERLKLRLAIEPMPTAKAGSLRRHHFSEMILRGRHCKEFSFTVSGMGKGAGVVFRGIDNVA